MANADANLNGANPFVTTRQITTPTVDGSPAEAQTLYPPEGPQPAGTSPEASAQMAQETPADPEAGAGIEGEELVWEARYSMKNFAGRAAFRTALTVAWLVLAGYTWGNGHNDIAPLTIALGAALVVFWVILMYRIAQARYGHYYRLTTRRLFVSTGLMRRRRDMMELLRVKDVFTRQSLVERWLSLGTVVVVSHEKDLPIFYITGVDDPKQVMDLVWHHARAERDRRSTKIDAV